MPMGRTRQSRKDLPRRMYFYHGAYYLIPKGGKRTSLGRDYAEALRKYADMVDPVIGRKNIGAVMDIYIQQKVPKKKPRTQEDYLDAIKRLRPVFGAMWPEDLEPKHIYQYLNARDAKVRANREIAVLSNVMQQAIEMGLINANPCKQVRRNEEAPRVRDVLDHEVAGLMAHTPDWLDAYIAIKSLTGLRQGDMLRLTAFAIRDDGLFVETGKRGKRLLFQITKSLRAALDEAQALRRRPSEARLFPISARGFKSAWARAMAKYAENGGERFAENDLRAQVGSKAMDKGMDAASMLGHSSDAVTRRHYVRGTRKVSPLG
jgi:integrase